MDVHLHWLVGSPAVLIVKRDHGRSDSNSTVWRYPAVLSTRRRDLAATACWGTQQTKFHGDNRYDGVFAMWYGKGPGVDRTGDAYASPSA